jgi:hypothetical protein
MVSQMSDKPTKKPKPKKPETLEDLKQAYLLTTSERGKRILLGLIKLKDPKFKG